MIESMEYSNLGWVKYKIGKDVTIVCSKLSITSKTLKNRKKHCRIGAVLKLDKTKSSST